jgi:hypothetical protein
MLLVKPRGNLLKKDNSTADALSGLGDNSYSSKFCGEPPTTPQAAPMSKASVLVPFNKACIAIGATSLPERSYR